LSKAHADLKQLNGLRYCHMSGLENLQV